MLKFLKGITIVALAVLSFGCKKDNNNGNAASMMVVYAVPGGAAADILVDGQKLNTTPLNYPGNTPYNTIASGSRNFKLTETGTTNLIAETGYSVPSAISFSLVFYDNPSVIKSFAVNDPITGSAASKAMVRFLNLSPGSPVLDVGTLNGSTFTKLFLGRAFENALSIDSTQNFVSIDPGTYNFDFRLTSTSISVMTSNGISLETGKNYTFYKIPTGSGLEIIKHN